jgi:hypothetical protein
MTLLIDVRNCTFPLSAGFVSLLEGELATVEPVPASGVILHFRDPGYSAETGGFHPVEICIRATGRIEYITDFAFVGRGPYAELVKEIDFDFSLGLLQHFSREFPIYAGRELFAVWQENFVAYHRMGAYTVEASEM